MTPEEELKELRKEIAELKELNQAKDSLIDFFRVFSLMPLQDDYSLFFAKVHLALKLVMLEPVENSTWPHRLMTMLSEDYVRVARALIALHWTKYQNGRPPGECPCLACSQLPQARKLEKIAELSSIRWISQLPIEKLATVAKSTDELRASALDSIDEEIMDKSANAHVFLEQVIDAIETRDVSKKTVDDLVKAAIHAMCGH